MDHAARKELKQRAAQAVTQGWKSISVDPAHLLELTREYREPPPPSEAEKRIKAVEDIVVSRDIRIRHLEQSLRTATERGRAEGHRESAEEMRALREQVASLTRRLHDIELTSGGGERRARSVGTPI